MRKKLILAFSAVLCCGLLTPAFAQVNETVVEEKVTVLTDSAATPAAMKDAKAGTFKMKKDFKKGKQGKAFKGKKFDKRRLPSAAVCDSAAQCCPDSLKGKARTGKDFRKGRRFAAPCDSTVCTDSAQCLRPNFKKDGKKAFLKDGKQACDSASCTGHRGGSKGPRQHSKGHRHHSR